MNEAHDTGLRERIAKAGSPEEIAKLLDEGSTYTQADDRTRRSWLATANRRNTELAKAGEAKAQ